MLDLFFVLCEFGFVVYAALKMYVYPLDFLHLWKKCTVRLKATWYVLQACESREIKYFLR